MQEKRLPIADYHPRFVKEAMFKIVAVPATELAGPQVPPEVKICDHLQGHQE